MRNVVGFVRGRDPSRYVLLDFVGNKNLQLPRELSSDAVLWERLRRAAIRIGVGSVFPANRTQAPIFDDHYEFARVGIPSIDLIDWDFPCWFKLCDNLSAVSTRSLDAVGEVMVELLRTL